MRAANKTNTWSIQPINKGNGGIGEDFSGVRFAFAPSQMGAQQGSYLTPGQTSDTAPAMKTRAYDYSVGLDGMVHVRVSLETIAKAGVGKSDLHLALPYSSVDASADGPFPLYLLGEFATPNGYQAPATIGILPGKSLGAIIVQELVGTSATLSAKQRNETPNDLNKISPVRVIRGAFAYEAF